MPKPKAQKPGNREADEMYHLNLTREKKRKSNPNLTREGTKEKENYREMKPGFKS
jgi:hypothetical protein